MMNEQWERVPDFYDYCISNWGRVWSYRFNRFLTIAINNYGVYMVGMMRANDGKQHFRSVPLLVANSFLEPPPIGFDQPTPINMDGDRSNNHVDNLVWRPRWFAVNYNRQFLEGGRYPYPILNKIRDTDTGEISMNSFECGKKYGLLEEDVVLSIINQTYAWPTYQYFEAI